MQHAPGSIVRARGRDWVVQPATKPPVYDLVPLGGTSAERTLLHADLEALASATFDLPDPARRGDHNACRMMRDAARLATRNAAGPYRSFGRLGFDPRPYQLVPLMLAMRLDPVRMLLADDVGIGKTIEALMIARELLDRGEIDGFSVLCPPHLAKQWHQELKNRFHIEAQLVLAGTTLGLERTLQSVDETIFTKYPFTIVSLDYVKQARRCNEFIQTCPKLVIVDEAHSCSPAGGRGRAARQQRHEVLQKLAAKAGQHMILVTATPHSGNDHSYGSLLGLLDPRFGPDGELSPDCANQDARIKALSRHFVQRRRKDIEKFLGDTHFPARDSKDWPYQLSAPMKRLVSQVAGFAEEYLMAQGAGSKAPRARGWALLSLLQAIASSPKAAAATLAHRAGGTAADAEHACGDVVEDLQSELLDEFEEEQSGGEVGLSIAGLEAELAAATQDLRSAASNRKFFQSLHAQAEAVEPSADAKLQQLLKGLKEHVDDKGGVVVFCRFVATAEYLREQIHAKYAKKAVVECVVGTLPDEERTKRIEVMVEQADADSLARILVCTDCLSEGVNLQESFDTVVHYDLSWNPNRHVQREGRVDRFGQPRDTIRVRQLWSNDTLFDAAVLDNNRKKRERIANELGYSIPIPITRDVLLNEILALARKLVPNIRTGYLFAELEEAESQAAAEEFDRQAQRMLDNERTFRSRFSQHQIDPSQVEAELAKVRAAVGHDSVAPFVRDGLRGCGVACESRERFDRVVLQPDSRPAVKEIVERTLAERQGDRRITFDGKPGLRRTLVVRTHPLVEQLAAHILDCALDPLVAGSKATLVAARCGALQVAEVRTRTMVVLLRNRFQIRTGGTDAPGFEMLAEEVHPVAWSVEGEALTRIADDLAARLVTAKPAGANLQPERVDRLMSKAMELLRTRTTLLAEIAAERAEALRNAHESTRHRRAGTRSAVVAPVGAPDILGVYIYLPVAGEVA